MSSSHRPVFFRLVADRSLKPGGLLLEIPAATDGAPLPAMNAEFLALSASFPCLLSAQQASRLEPAVLQGFMDAGCRVLGDAELHRSDDLLKPALPAGALWLDGDWALAPPGKPVGSQTASRALALKLLQLVVADADTREIEDVFRQDPTLSYHLLRVVNSVGMGAGRQVSSFSQAIMLLGRQQLRRWLNLMLFAARSDDYRAPMLLARVCARARCMELLARLEGRDRSEQEMAFMAGMFSMLGVLFGLPLPELFAPLQVSEILVNAVLRHEGDIGRLLRAVLLAQAGDAAALAPLLEHMQVSGEQFNQITVEAHQWMLGVVRETQGASHA